MSCGFLSFRSGRLAAAAQGRFGAVPPLRLERRLQALDLALLRRELDDRLTRRCRFIFRASGTTDAASWSYHCSRSDA